MESNIIYDTTSATNCIKGKKFIFDILLQSALWLGYVDQIGRDIHTPGSFELSGDFSKHTRHIWWEEWRWFAEINAWYLKETRKDQQNGIDTSAENAHTEHTFTRVFNFQRLQLQNWYVLQSHLTWDAFSIILESCSRPRTFRTPPQNIIELAGRTLVAPSIPWIADHLDSSPSIDTLLQDILQGNAVAVYDGSYFEQYDTAAAAWTLSSADG